MRILESLWGGKTLEQMELVLLAQNPAEPGAAPAHRSGSNPGPDPTWHKTPGAG